MGAHLGRGKSTSIVSRDLQIEGDSIRCPYHGWRYDPSGQVDDIPKHSGPCPRSARLRSYPVTEALGAVMMWHDPEYGEPEFSPPALVEWEDPHWIAGVYDHLGVIGIHSQELLDNMADSNHFGPVHGLPPEYFANEFRGHMYFQYQGGFRHEYDAYMRTNTFYTGPGLLISRQRIGAMNCIEFIFHTPVDDGSVRVWHNMMMHTDNPAPGEAERAAQKEAQGLVLAAFSQDFDIWSTKAPATSIMVLKQERNLLLARAWYRQFFNPRVAAAAVHAELDGTYPVEHLAAPDAEARV
jgi:3-ketosteroid 9alpha-monooxygenase subunit A